MSGEDSKGVSSSRRSDVTAGDGRVDVAIVTALKIERDAVLRQLGDHETVRDDNQPLTYYRGRVEAPVAGGGYEVVVVKMLEAGNDEAAVATSRVIERWQPRSVFMVGIAGGVRGEVELGDVVVANYVHYYEPAKLVPGGEQDRSQDFRTDRLLYGRAQAYEASEWRGEIDAELPEEDTHDARRPEAHFGPIGSGEKVVADEEALRQLLVACPKMLATAMEGAGVARAAADHGDRSPAFLEVRGISDYADHLKNDDWHRYAAAAASAFTVGLLRSAPFPSLAATDPEPTGGKPLLVIRAQSLRPIAGDEILGAFDDDLKGRDLETLPLDFTDLAPSGAITDPESAARRLADPQGALLGALARRGDADLVFHGLAHVPLIFLAGHLVTDRQPVRLFDFHPEVGGGTWAWPGAESFPPLEISGMPERKVRRTGDAVVRVSISYETTAAQTRAAVPRPALEIDAALQEPKRGVVQSEDQVRRYGQVFRREVLDPIARLAPGIERVHVFYAGPVALAFHLGQQISENIHPPVVVWNYSRGYGWAVDLAAAAVGEPCVVRPHKS